MYKLIYLKTKIIKKYSKLKLTAGAITAPILATNEQDPKAVARILVGIDSTPHK